MRKITFIYSLVFCILGLIFTIIGLCLVQTYPIWYEIIIISITAGTISLGQILLEVWEC